MATITELQKQEEYNSLLELSAFTLPNNVSESGLSDDRIKQKFYMPVLYLHKLFCEFRDTYNVRDDEINNIIEGLNNALTNLSNRITNTNSKIDENQALIDQKLESEINDVYAKIEEYARKHNIDIGDVLSKIDVEVSKVRNDYGNDIETAVRNIKLNALPEFFNNKFNFEEINEGATMVTLGDRTIISNEIAQAIIHLADLLSNGVSLEGIIGDLSDKANQTDIARLDEAINTIQSTKANLNALKSVATTGSYNDLSDKPSIPNKVSDISNDSGFINSNQATEIANTRATEIVSTAINNHLSDVFKVVTSLPSVGLAGKIYLVAKTGTSEENNAYEEYLYINDKWERIGALSLNLDGYATENIVTEMLSAYAKKSGTYDDLIVGLSSLTKAIEPITTAPTNDNNKGLKLVHLTSDPSTKYNGYIYIITEEGA